MNYRSIQFLIIILFFLPVALFAQRTKLNAYDPFLKKQCIEMEPLTVISNQENKAAFVFKAVDTSLYLQLSGSGWGANTIDEGDAIIFLFSNDSVVTLRSTRLQSFEPGTVQSNYRHEYRLTPNDLGSFSAYELIGMRKYSFRQFSDLAIPRQNIPAIKQLSASFLSELKKSGVLRNDVAAF